MLLHNSKSLVFWCLLYSTVFLHDSLLMLQRSCPLAQLGDPDVVKVQVFHCMCKKVKNYLGAPVND